MKRIMIIVGSVVYNRGSEALIRGLSNIIKEKYKNNIEITLVSGENNFDSTICIDNIDKYVKKSNYNSVFINKTIIKVLDKLKLYNFEMRILYSKLMKLAKKNDLVIIIGADNYDISYNMQEKMYAFNKYFRKNGIKMLLYDCSIDKKDITNVLKKDISAFETMTVRDTISYENIKKINKKVYLYHDPAFIMEPEEVPLPSIMKKEKFIGINASNLIIKNSENIVINSYVNLIKYILNYTKYNIVLIPHVMNNSDLDTLKIIYKNFISNDRVYLIDNQKLNAKQLKYIISRCSLFVGARTHSTIAAYSSKIPTLVLGYSIKSKGIAKDLFGTYENYVLPVQNIKNDNYLINGFKWLVENEKNIKQQLNNNIGEYIKNSKKIIELIDSSLK